MVYDAFGMVVGAEFGLLGRLLWAGTVFWSTHKIGYRGLGSCWIS